MVIIELIEVIMEIILSGLSPEGVAEKVNNSDISKRNKWILITVFTLIYGVALAVVAFSLVAIHDILYKVFAVILFIFLLFCLFKFYYRIFKD